MRTQGEVGLWRQIPIDDPRGAEGGRPQQARKGRTFVPKADKRHRYGVTWHETRRRDAGTRWEASRRVLDTRRLHSFDHSVSKLEKERKIYDAGPVYGAGQSHQFVAAQVLIYLSRVASKSRLQRQRGGDQGRVHRRHRLDWKKGTNMGEHVAFRERRRRARTDAFHRIRQ